MQMPCMALTGRHVQRTTPFFVRRNHEEENDHSLHDRHCMTVIFLACLIFVLGGPGAQVGPTASGTTANQAPPVATPPAAPSAAQPSLPGTNWGFENGLIGWMKSGGAFDNQPVYGNNVTVERAVAGKLITMPLGGGLLEAGRLPHRPQGRLLDRHVRQAE